MFYFILLALRLNQTPRSYSAVARKFVRIKLLWRHLPQAYFTVRAMASIGPIIGTNAAVLSRTTGRCGNGNQRGNGKRKTKKCKGGQCETGKCGTRQNNVPCSLALATVWRLTAVVWHRGQHVYVGLRHSDVRPIFMTTQWNRAGHYIFVLWFLFLSIIFFFFSSPILSRRRLDVYTILSNMMWS